MNFVAELLDRAKSAKGLPSDYALAKRLETSQGLISGYRSGKSMPDERFLSRLCDLSGDDFAIVAAEIQAERARTPEGKSLWLAIAERLRASAAPATLSALIAMNLAASMPTFTEDGEPLTTPPLDLTNNTHRISALAALLSFAMVLRKERRKNQRPNSPRYFVLPQN